MANYTNLTDLFTDMAEAIRTKTNSTAPIIADNFPVEIEALRTGFDYNNHDITTIPDYAFYGCEDLNNVDCYNVTSIGTSAFEGCVNLKSVTLYDNIESIGENAFKGCSNVTIYCYMSEQPPGWHENWNPDNCEVVWMTPIETWDVSATEADNVVAKLYNDIHNEDYYSLIINGNGNIRSGTYNSFPWYTEYSTTITTIFINYGITSIGDYAFSYCSSLTSIIIPNSVTRINAYALRTCTSLASITIPNSVTSIGYSILSSCTSLTSITIPSSITSIPRFTFDYCKSLASITIPDSIRSIGVEAFRDCYHLTNIAYAGTIAQWQAITFYSDWNDGTPDYTIYCTDGTITKDGTITYN